MQPCAPALQLAAHGVSQKSSMGPLHTSAHPRTGVLPLQLNSGVEGSLEDKVGREILELLGGYRCDVRHIQLLLSPKASYQEEEWPGHNWSS